ncbi:hypothetical protein FDI64_gp07 [Mycobacterium phage Zemanar]|uniref:Uncharacterized protein n=1 Tax=Mycobacterium phage Zemanar TaxID=1034151 RepID=G1BPB7_9CAUD|nr:hypothetical protein FDI64_gp07 [Mycobacterium phage Zemanar]AEJ95770.1 hypothetical protein ZEMANAR_7 [Mycobacterium phage Zemanar]
MHKMTRAQWNALAEAKQLDDDTLYFIGDDTVYYAKAPAQAEIVHVDGGVILLGTSTPEMACRTADAPPADQDSAGDEVPRRGAGAAGRTARTPAVVGRRDLGLRRELRRIAWCVGLGAVAALCVRRRTGRRPRS